MQINLSKGTGFAEIWPPSPIYRAYRHGMGFRSRSARSFCTLTSPITFSIGVIQGSRTVCDDHMEPAHDWNTAQRALAIRGGKPRRRKWPLEETLHFPMNLNDFIVFVENLLLQIVRDHCNRKKEDDYGEKKTEWPTAGAVLGCWYRYPLQTVVLWKAHCSTDWGSCQCTHYHEHPCPMECPAYQRISLWYFRLNNHASKAHYTFIIRRYQ